MSKTEAVGDPDSTEVLEEGSRSILLSLASQLRKGMDLVSGLRTDSTMVAAIPWNQHSSQCSFFASIESLSQLLY